MTTAAAPATTEPIAFGQLRVRSFTAALLLLMALGLGVRLTALATAASCRVGADADVLALAHQPASGCVIINDTTNFLSTAKADATGHWFQQPRADGTGYEESALHPPLFALLLSIPYRLGVHGIDGLRAVTACLGLATIGLTGLVGRRIGGARVGLIAAALVAVHPMVWINDVVLMSEALYAPLALLAMAAAYRWWDAPSVRRAAELGLAIALATLTRSEAVLGIVLIGVPLCLGHRRLPRRDRWRSLGALAAVAIVAVAPLLAYNQVRFHRPVAFTTSLGIAERLANCDATYFTRDQLGSRSPACLLSLADPSRQESITLPPDPDQSDFDAALRHGARTYVDANLGRAPVVALARFGRMWGVYQPFATIRADEPVEQRGVGRSQLALVLGWAVTGLAVAGALVLFRRRVPLSPLLAWVASASIVAVGDLGLARFRAASELALCLLAAVAVDRWLSTRALPVAEP